MVGYSFFSLPTHISDSQPSQGDRYARGNAEPRKTNNPPESGPERQKSAIPVFRNDAEKRSEKPGASNNPAGLVAHARNELGSRYGLGRPLRKTELARLVGLSDEHGADHVSGLEKGKAVLSGPVEVVIRMLLEGHRSPRHEEALRSRYADRDPALDPQKRPGSSRAGARHG